MEPPASANPPSAVEKLAEELTQRWAAAFALKNWAERLELLNQLHEQLLEDLGDLDLYSAVSPVFIRKLIVSLSGGPVTSAAQAHIYANSDDAEHRRAAGEWLGRQKTGPKP